MRIKSVILWIINIYQAVGGLYDKQEKNTFILHIGHTLVDNPFNW